MKMYVPNGFTTDQANILNWTEHFIEVYGDRVNNIVLESMKEEYPLDEVIISWREHFWDVCYTLQTTRQWKDFHSQL